MSRAVNSIDRLERVIFDRKTAVRFARKSPLTPLCQRGAISSLWKREVWEGFYENILMLRSVLSVMCLLWLK